jgi:hypothetical protein
MAYHARTIAEHVERGISQSALKEFRQAPLLYYYRYGLGNPKPETDAMRQGTALHVAVLEPERWHELVAVEEKADGRTKEGKAYRAAFAEASIGKTIITADTGARVLAAAAALRAHPSAAALLGHERLIEHGIEWVDAETGVKCYGTPDLIVPGLGIIADVKSCRDASEHGFGRAIAQMDYHIQAAYYLDGWRASGGALCEWLWLAVEVEPPYLCAVYAASDAMLDAGRTQYRRDLTRWRECVEADRWPGYPEQIKTLDLPRWASKQLDEIEQEDWE